MLSARRKVPIMTVVRMPSFDLLSSILPVSLISMRSILFPMSLRSSLVGRVSSLVANAWVNASAWASACFLEIPASQRCWM